MYRFITILSLSAALLFLQGCFKNAEHFEISRLTSSDKLVDAVLIRTNVDATTSYVYRVYIVPAAKKVTEDMYEVFKSDKTKDIKLKWLKAKELVIQYKNARIFQFKNFWQHRDINNLFYIVNINLVKK